MAYITPNSDVYLLKGVSLDKDYNHTILQSTAAAQATLFISYKKYQLDKYSYQRAGKGKIRVGILADNLYDCNYMMFRNTAYGSKWFYAFIDSVDYVNDNATEVNYTIDVMQTWYFDYELGSCYVEREHTLTDGLGANLVPENFTLNELIVQNTWTYCYPQDTNNDGIMYYCVVFYVPNNVYINGYADGDYTIENLSNDQKGNVMNGVYTGYMWYPVSMNVSTTAYQIATAGLINKLINKIVGNEGTIVRIIQIPKYLWDQWVTNHGAIVVTNKNQLMSRTNYNVTRTSSYTAKNNKIYTYPFKSLIVSNNNGETSEYKWEYFSSESGNQKQATFGIQGVPIPIPEIMCYPKNYRGIQNDYDSGIILSDFPEPSWNEDSFSKWWATNKETFAFSVISSVIKAIGGGVGTLGADLVNVQKMWRTPDQAKGEGFTSALRSSQNRIGFRFYDMGLEYGVAKTIDDYFTMYGYAIKQVKVPNVRATGVTLRPHWNYVQTRNCIIHPSTGKGLPSEDEKQIARIYDNGITFWTYLSEVGDYSLNNAPT